MRFLICFLIVLNASCNYGNLTVLADLPSTLDEVSGIETIVNSKYLWMINDSGNTSKIYGINHQGEIKTELKIKAKNHDWEDITSDKEGNLYVGDFGNNHNKRKNLAILKVSKDSLHNKGKIHVTRINFEFPDQTKFLPKKKHLRFDCEAFFFYNDSLYLFTKSRIKNNFGLTNLYKIPAQGGNHIAEFISSFSTCSELPCWITAADISYDEKQIALLTLNSVWIFKDFTGDDFFSGSHKKHSFQFESQKESICFTDSNTLLIADEKAHGKGGNLYKFNFND